MVTIFFALMFGAAALVCFILAFSNVAKGRIGTAIALGFVAVVSSGIAGGFAVAID